MDSAALPSLTPFLDGVDRWAELLPLLPVLVALELVLSADNAIALAAVARKQKDPAKEKKALDYGIAIAFFLRVALILLAQWVLAFQTVATPRGCLSAVALSCLISGLRHQALRLLGILRAFIHDFLPKNDCCIGLNRPSFFNR